MSSSWWCEVIIIFGFLSGIDFLFKFESWTANGWMTRFKVWTGVFFGLEASQFITFLITTNRASSYDDIGIVLTSLPNSLLTLLWIKAWLWGSMICTGSIRFQKQFHARLLNISCSDWHERLLRCIIVRALARNFTKFIIFLFLSFWFSRLGRTIRFLF